MIYVATESEPAPYGGSQEDLLTGPGAQLKSCMERHPLTQAGSRNRSLVFGPAIVRISQSNLHLCGAGETAVRHVNRLWYGRALVALRTYPQWTLRANAIRQRAHNMHEDGADECAIILGNPFQ